MKPLFDTTFNGNNPYHMIGNSCGAYYDAWQGVKTINVLSSSSREPPRDISKEKIPPSIGQPAVGQPLYFHYDVVEVSPTEFLHIYVRREDNGS